MKKKRIIVSGILVAVCSVFFLTSCKTKEADKVTITLIHGWGSTEADHIAMRKIYEDFEKENPDIAKKYFDLRFDGIYDHNYQN